MPAHQSPLKLLKTHGVERLLDEELLAIAIGARTRDETTLEQCRNLLTQSRAVNSKTVGTKLRAGRELGSAKRARAIAALELARRNRAHGLLKVRAPDDVKPLLLPYQRSAQEHFLCISLNGSHSVIATRVITIGLVDRTQVHPREVFADAITDRAVGVILAHNHPSGELTPSNEDHAVTKRLVEAGQILGIKVLDHIIFSSAGFKSLKEEGCM